MSKLFDEKLSALGITLTEKQYQQFDKYYHKVGTIAETKTEPLISAVSSEFRSKAGVGVNVKTARKLPLLSLML